MNMRNSMIVSANEIFFRNSFEKDKLLFF